MVRILDLCLKLCILGGNMNLRKIVDDIHESRLKQLADMREAHIRLFTSIPQPYAAAVQQKIDRKIEEVNAEFDRLVAAEMADYKEDIIEIERICK